MWCDVPATPHASRKKGLHRWSIAQQIEAALIVVRAPRADREVAVAAAQTMRVEWKWKCLAASQGGCKGLPRGLARGRGSTFSDRESAGNRGSTYSDEGPHWGWRLKGPASGSRGRGGVILLYYYIRDE